MILRQADKALSKSSKSKQSDSHNVKDYLIKGPLNIQNPVSKTKFSSVSVLTLSKNNQYPGLIIYSAPPSFPTIEPQASPTDPPQSLFDN